MEYKKSEAKEYAREKLVADYSTIPTPFTQDDKLDEDGLRANVNHIADLGVKGLGCNWLSGEFWALTDEEKKSIARIVTEECHRRRIVPIVHTSHHSVHECVKFTRYVEDIGATFATILPPYFNIKDEKDAVRFIEKVANQVDIGLLIFNNPLSGVPLSPQGLSKVADLKNIVGVKDAIQDVTHAIHTHWLAGHKMVVSYPSDEIFFIGRAYNIQQQVMFASTCDWMFDLPDGKRNYVKFVNLATSGGLDREAEQNYREKILPLRRLYMEYMDYSAKRDKGAFPAPMFKAWGEYVGMKIGSLREPPQPFTNQEKQEMWSKLEKAGLKSRLTPKVSV